MSSQSGYIYAVLRRELERIRRYPILSTLLVVLPVLSFLFFALFFSQGVPRNIPVAVLDRDNSTLSRKLVNMIDATPAALVSYSIQDMDEGERMVREGRVSAVISIPRDFEKDILSNVRTGVEAYISGLNISANGMLSKDIQTAVTTFSSGIQIQILMKQGMSEEQAYVQMMPVSFDKHVLFNPYVNYGYYLLPSFMPMMLLIFAVMSSVFAIGMELKRSTAGEWFAAAGGNTFAAVVGKLAPYTTGLILMLLLMNTIMYKWIGVPLNGSLALLTVAGILFILAYQSIGVMMISLLGNLRLSLSLGGGYSVLAFTFSGLTFPMMAMNRFSQVLSRFFPFTYYTEIFVDQAMRGAPAVHSMLPLLILALFVLLPLLCLPRLKTVATDSRYWGKL